MGILEFKNPGPCGNYRLYHILKIINFDEELKEVMVLH